MVTQPLPGPALPAPGTDPDVVVAVVTHNSRSVIERFLRCLPAALAGVGTATVVVVDNSSLDGTPDIVRERAPWATVIETGDNLGYAAGVNRALSHSGARRGVYVLNPDAMPSPGSVELLARAVEADPAVGIAVPRIFDEDGLLSYSLRREPTIARALGEAVLGGRRAARFPALGEVMTHPADYVDGATADWATGAAMFLAPRTVSTVGTWDEDYFLYSEETDYALRARDAGLCLRLVSDAEVVHRGGDMETSPWLWSLVAVNRTRLYRRRHRRLPSSLYWLAVLLNEGLRAPRGRTHRAAFRALLLGVRPPSAIAADSAAPRPATGRPRTTAQALRG